MTSKEFQDWLKPKLRPLRDFPEPNRFDRIFFGEVTQEWQDNTDGSLESLAKLCYKLGYDKCGNVTGWD